MSALFLILVVGVKNKSSDRKQWLRKSKRCAMQKAFLCIGKQLRLQCCGIYMISVLVFGFLLRKLCKTAAKTFVHKKHYKQKHTQSLSNNRLKEREDTSISDNTISSHLSNNKTKTETKLVAKLTCRTDERVTQ